MKRITDNEPEVFMHKNFVLGKIVLVLILALFVIGCAATNAATQVASNKTSSSSEIIVMKAEAVPEGISLTFENIPAETTRLFVHFQEWGNKEEINSTHDITSSYADIRNSSLEQVRQTGKIIFPYVKSGQKYMISASLWGNDIPLIEDENNNIYAECTASSGIYLNNDLELSLNETHTSSILNAEPSFTKEVFYAPIKYHFDANIDKGDNSSIGYSEIKTVDYLTWNFEPLMTNDLKPTGYLDAGSYPAYITAYSNLVYENIEWSVEIAKSEEFTFTYSM
jgi:hypothetical protein